MLRSLVNPANSSPSSSTTCRAILPSFSFATVKANHKPPRFNMISPAVKLVTAVLLLACVVVSSNAREAPIKGEGGGGGSGDGGGSSKSVTCDAGQSAEICRRRRSGRVKCIRRYKGGPTAAGWKTTGYGSSKKCCLTGGAKNKFPTARNCYRAGSVWRGKRRECWASCV